MSYIKQNKLSNNLYTKSMLETLKEIFSDQVSLNRWRDFIVNASDDQLFRINAFELAEKWELDGRDILTELIHATSVGIMVLNWDVVCPMCSEANQFNHLDKVHSRQNCPRCSADFDVILDNTVEVSFTIHPGIRFLDLSTISTKRTSVRHVTGLDCTTLPAFREFFSSDVLSTEESLKVQDVTIMFTDIKGSTAIYERLGDVRAYRAVRYHFEKLFTSVLQNGGAIIKTIGDAIMASFTEPVQAMRAALDAQELFKEFRPLLPDSTEAISVKIGIHHGPCITVTLNERLDFFGSAVNIAARAQQQAGGGEIVITEMMYSDAYVREFLNRSDKAITSLQTRLRGLSSEFLLYKITGQTAKEKKINF
jgi:class 3 adenylate cyclase